MQNASVSGGSMQTILIVANDCPNLEAARRDLERAGFYVLGCVDGETALYLVRGDRIIPDAIIVDYDLPGMTGLDLLARFKRSLNQTIPTLLMCESMPPMTGFLLGVRGFLRKPFARQFLLQSLRNILKGEEDLEGPPFRCLQVA